MSSACLFSVAFLPPISFSLNTPWTSKSQEHSHVFISLQAAESCLTTVFSTEDSAKRIAASPSINIGQISSREPMNHWIRFFFTDLPIQDSNFYKRDNRFVNSHTELLWLGISCEKNGTRCRTANRSTSGRMPQRSDFHPKRKIIQGRGWLEETDKCTVWDGGDFLTSSSWSRMTEYAVQAGARYADYYHCHAGEVAL